MGMTSDKQHDTVFGNAKSHPAILEPSLNDNVSQGPQALNKPSTTQTENKKYSKAKTNKKQTNSDNNYMEGSGSATIKQRSPSQAPRGR